MKLTRNLAASLIALLFVAYGCSDDDNPGIQQPDPITPDLGVKVKASVSGFVSDENNNPIPYVNVQAGNKSVSTDEYGYFKVQDASLPEIAGQVVVAKPGYISSYKTFLPQNDEETFLRITLLGNANAGSINAETGGTATSTGGVSVTLPANSVVVEANAEVYGGSIGINARAFDTGADLIPGDGRGTDGEGHLKGLKSFGAIAVELAAANGQPLQIADGKTATINIPITPELVATAPATIALWWFDSKTGLWKEDGTATKNGSVYTATVSHFSFWQVAEGIPLVNFTARITNTASQPLANVPVVVTIAGMPRNAGHSRFGYTNANGYVTGAVFANSSFVLDVATTCSQPAYSHEFATGNTDKDLGTLIGNLGQNAVILSGSVRNCNNQPIANGFVQTYDNGFYNRIPVVNGSFFFSGVMCTNTTVNLVVVDYTTYQQNTPKSVTINPGNNALGALSACGVSTVGKIEYRIDDGPNVTIQEPADTLAAYYLGVPGQANTNATQILTLSGEPNTAQKMAFQIRGLDNTTDTHTVTDIYSTAIPGGKGYWPVPIPVQITSYGKVGGFIEGSFTSQIIATVDNNASVHNFTCTFKVRRHK